MAVRVADYIVQKLQDEGVRHVFLVTGRGLLFLSDAVARQDGIEGISTYHEQGASYAAMAYAQAGERLGACLVSTGCAAANAVTAALCAWQDNVPVIFISGQHMLKETTHYSGLDIRTYGSQEADIVQMVQSITKCAVMLTRAEDVAFELEKAIYIARSGRPGPVWLDIPLDIQNIHVDAMQLRHYTPSGERINPTIETTAVEYVLTELASAERPILLLGGGVRTAKAETLAASFAEQCGLPVVYTPAGADAYGSAHDLSIGAVGTLGGSRAGNFAVQNADCILAVGTKLCSLITGTDYEQFARAAKIIVVDIDEKEHQKEEVPYERFVHADACDFFRMMLAQEIPQMDLAWKDKCRHWKHIFQVMKEPFVQEIAEKNQIELYAFAHMLGACLPTDAAVITDAGLEELIIPSAIPYRDGQRCLFPAAQGAMGYAVPAILGAHFAGCKNIIAVIGDGSIMMNIQELYAIVSHKISAKIFVINNNMYAVIRKRQKDLFRHRTIGNDPSDGLAAPDFSKIADAVGLRYRRIDSFAELNSGIQEVIGVATAVLCEVMCVHEQPYLHRSYARNERKQLEYRPLEDLSPFMERSILKREMIVS